MRGGHYPVLPTKMFYSQLFQYLQILFFVVLFLGEPICENVLGYAQGRAPEWLRAVGQNKMGGFMFIWLFGNMVQSSFLQTNAFEIYHGDNVVWSSINSQRMPTYNDIVRGFKKSGVEFMQSSVGP